MLTQTRTQCRFRLDRVSSEWNMCFQWFKDSYTQLTCMLPIMFYSHLCSVLSICLSWHNVVCSPSVCLCDLGGLIPGVHILLSAWAISYCTLREYGQVLFILTACVNHMSSFPSELQRHSRFWPALLFFYEDKPWEPLQLPTLIHSLFYLSISVLLPFNSTS